MISRRFLIVSAVLAFSLLLITPASALFLPSNGQAATLVIGQPDFSSSAAATSQSGLRTPFDVAVDPTTGKVFVAEIHNNRVLRFADVSALSDGAAAEAVLGQLDFTSSAPNTTQNGLGAYYNEPYSEGPYGLAVDASGRLWVADSLNNRILRYDNAASKANGSNADAVLGQPDFTSNSPNTTQSGMWSPLAVDVDSAGRLWVADTFNHRVLRFDNAAGKANGASADGVLGQPDFSTRTPNLTETGMSGPSGLVVDTTGELWVADSWSNRVLRFDNAAAKANGGNADGVLGQPDFVSSATKTTQSGMSNPLGVAVDGGGGLFVADTYNNRILHFKSAASLGNGANANDVLGQTDFVTGSQNSGGISASTLSQPTGVFFDPAAQVVWETEAANNRVLMYGHPYATLHILPFIGLVRRFVPPGVTPIGIISIQTEDGSVHTFDWSSDSRILPSRRAASLGVGSFVTLLARVDPVTGQYIALQVVIHPEGTGPGFLIDIPTATSTPAGVPTPGQ